MGCITQWRLITQSIKSDLILANVSHCVCFDCDSYVSGSCLLGLKHYKCSCRGKTWGFFSNNELFSGRMCSECGWWEDVFSCIMLCPLTPKQSGSWEPSPLNTGKHSIKEDAHNVSLAPSFKIKILQGPLTTGYCLTSHITGLSSW